MLISLGTGTALRSMYAPCNAFSLAVNSVVLSEMHCAVQDTETVQRPQQTGTSRVRT